MAARKSGLGKGIDTLIAPSKSVKTKEENKGVTYVNINKVEPNRNQPRHKFDEEKLEELSKSIGEHGILEPLIVQDREDYYEIIAGERRWRAAKMAELKEVPVIIKHYTEQEIVEISLIENIQREDLNPIEEAQAYKRLLNEFNLKQEEVAKRVSKSRAAVTNSMRLLKLDEKVQQMVINEEITTGHARALLALENDKQFDAAKKIVNESISVRGTEKMVKSMQQDKSESTKKKQDNRQLELVYQNIAEKMKAALGTKVSIVPKDNQKGKIEIEYYSSQELERLLDVFTK